MQLIISISTHSLTRRLTDQHSNNIRIRGYFNSQPHKEADQLETDLDKIEYISTHSLTRRLTKIQKFYGWTKEFQLTASQGG